MDAGTSMCVPNLKRALHKLGQPHEIALTFFHLAYRHNLEADIRVLVACMIACSVYRARREYNKVAGVAAVRLPTR